MLKQTARALLRLCYRVRVQGMEHDAETGGRTLIVTNPSSLLDALFIASMLPRRMALAVDRRLARRWWMKPFLALSDVVEVDFSSPTSTLALVRALDHSLLGWCGHLRAHLRDRTGRHRSHADPDHPGSSDRYVPAGVL